MKNVWKLLLCSAAVSALLNASDYQVMFETTSCSGETGFATAKVEDVYRIEAGDCSAPDNPKEKLKKILIKNGKGSYDVFTLTASEAKSVIGDMKLYMKARLNTLENANTLIIDK